MPLTFYFIYVFIPSRYPSPTRLGTRFPRRAAVLVLGGGRWAVASAGRGPRTVRALIAHQLPQCQRQVSVRSASACPPSLSDLRMRK